MAKMEVLKLDIVVGSKLNQRKTFDEEKLKELAESIKEKGVIQPIVVRPAGDKYEIVSGERRVRASKMAGVDTIPAVIRELDDHQALEVMVIENLQREDVHPLEEAEGYEALIKKHGYKSAEDIAVKVGKSKWYVYNRLKLCDLIPENRKLFYSGEISPSVALLVARLRPQDQKAAGRAVAGDTLSEARSYITRNYMLLMSSAPWQVKKSPCATCPKRTVNEKELFADVGKDDRCTDQKCFEDQKKKHLESLIVKAKDAGKKVLSRAESEKNVVCGSINNPAWVNLDSVCYGVAGDPKYRELLKKAPDVESFMVINAEDGTLIEAVDKKALRSALRKSGEKIADDSSDYMLQEKLRRKEEKIRKKAVSLTVDKVLQQCRLDKEQKYMRMFAASFLRTAGMEGVMLFMRHRDPAIKRDQAYEEIKKHLEVISDSELIFFCIELLVYAECIWRDSDLLTALTKAYSVDYDEILKKLKRESGKDKK